MIAFELADFQFQPGFLADHRGDGGFVKRRTLRLALGVASVSGAEARVDALGHGDDGHVRDLPLRSVLVVETNRIEELAAELSGFDGRAVVGRRGVDEFPAELASDALVAGLFFVTFELEQRPFLVSDERDTREGGFGLWDGDGQCHFIVVFVVVFVVSEERW